MSVPQDKDSGLRRAAISWVAKVIRNSSVWALGGEPQIGQLT